ncbi:glycosyltransferase 87 family protein [Jatrophihabitans fulvus]
MVGAGRTVGRRPTAPSLGTVVARPGAATAAVALLALVVRLAVLWRNDPVRGTFGYDSGVYFAGSDAFVHGRLPYRDFVLLHPPLLMVALTPFAALARFVGDNAAFTVALTSFAVLGAGNAGLVVLVARALGLRWRAALAGGVFYAVWDGVVGAEYLLKLETLANTLLLVALLGLLRARRPWPTALAAVLLGLFATVKIWDAVPAVLLLLWFARRTPGRALAVVAGAATGAVVVNLPFLLAAPRAMWTSVVADQLGRPSSHTGTAGRLADLTGISHLLAGPTARDVAAVAGVVAVLALARRAARDRQWGRPLLVLLAACLAVLLLSPSWFVPYCAFAAVPLALVVAVAAHVPAAAGRRTVPVLVSVSALVTVLAAALPLPRGGVVRDAAELQRAVAPYRCVMSDTPVVLIRLNVLSRDFAHNCANWVDVTGRTYGRDRGTGPRRSNLRWQHDLRRYLASGDVVVLGRVAGSGISRTTLGELRRGGTVASAGGHTVYLSPSRPPKAPRSTATP